MTVVRCAIYTRKSSEEGLEQDFNSLDAQREACAAYVLSQASEGWKQVGEQYDDGGLSGGTLQRPALLRLLDDVKLGKVDIIVVYKVDRLTRSLLDFAKLVEALDAAGVSFVSVTQSFNTTTSMGRLTLNMLLSFAQFEREVTAERIRDKIAASKARGMWMGGLPPLGYRPDGRSLAIIEEHAELVRSIYRRYLELGTVRLLADALAHEGVMTPARQTEKGFAYGGRRFSRGQLYHLLKNPIYAGKISHKGKVWDGNHPAIIDQVTWDKVQAQLADHTQGARIVRERSGSLLAGKLFDAGGTLLTPTHTTRGTRRYRYYVSQAGQDWEANCAMQIQRIPASEIEPVVITALATELTRPLALLEKAQIPVSQDALPTLGSKCAAISARLLSDQTAVRQLLNRVVVHRDRIELYIAAAGLADLLSMPRPHDPAHTVCRTIRVRLRQDRKVGRLVEETGAAAISKPDPRSIRYLLKARSWWQELAKGEVDITTLAKREGVTASYMTRVVRLQFLSPKVTEAILAGKIREEAGPRALIRTDAIAPLWGDQERLYLPR
ncbi:MAG: recombinase family protein [Novosphingobium sp.]|jgi:site-specific DNA recombinase|uniref:recombinase family protein n=1 Tax=Novosphingobium sp. TaxID=1874826 RepID=UPI00391CB346